MDFTDRVLTFQKYELRNSCNGCSYFQPESFGESSDISNIRACTSSQIFSNFQVSEFSDLSKLSQLKKLKISFTNTEDSTFNESLSFLENESLEQLEIQSYRNELKELTVIALGLKVPRLNHLKLNSRSSLNIINPIINFFPFLTSLELNGLTEKGENPFVFQVGLVHRHLKKLVVVGPNTECKNFIQLKSALQNLQELKISLPVSKSFLREILTLPQLKVLDLTPQWNLITVEHKLTKEFVDVLKTYGTNLNIFQGEFYSLYSTDLKLEEIQEEFMKLYATVKINDGFGVVEWFMKK